MSRHMSKTGSFIVSILVLLSVLIVNPFIVQIVSADELDFYVSNTGKDSNNGLSAETPWQNISKVNSEFGSDIQLGDNVYFKRGEVWSGKCLTIGTGGSAINEMIIGAYGSGDNPVINSTDSVGCITFDGGGIDYVRIENFSLTTGNTASRHGIRARESGLSHITIADCNFTDCNIGVRIGYQIDYYTIENCVFTNIFYQAIQVLGYHTNSPSNGILRNIVINGCANDAVTLHEGEVGGINYPLGKNHLLENVSVNDVANENSFDITSGENIFILNCSSSNNTDSSMLNLGHGAKNITIDGFYHSGDWGGLYLSNCTNVVIRNSVSYDSYTYYSLTVSGDQLLHNVSVYNNDFIYADAPRSIIRMGEDPVDTTNLAFKNNIITSTNNIEEYFVDYGGGAEDPDSSESIWEHNLYWPGNGNTAGLYWAYAPGGTHNFTDWNAEYPTDIMENPQFTNISNLDFALDQISPAIDSGTWLTNTTSDGTSNFIPVDRVHYFFSGLPTLEVSGDNIFVGSNTNIEVIEVNYDNSTLKVNRTITYNSGDNVSLSDFHGDAPDIGAYEYGSDDVLTGDGYQYWDVSINDPDGDTTSGTIVCSDGSSTSWTNQPNGTFSLNMTNLCYDTNYTVWLNFTDGTCSIYETFWFYTDESWILNPYPSDGSVEISRPPVNLSADITGSDVDAFIYFVNMTPSVSVWTLVDSFPGVSSERVEYTTLDSFGHGTEFLWGNTEYTWSVNVTDGESWTNQSFTYTTIALVSSEDARYEVSKDSNINVVDLNRCWSHRTVSGYAPYDGFYDVSDDGNVNVVDLNRIWSHNTI